MKSKAIILVATLALLSCTRKPSNKYSDSTIRTIVDLQDRRQTDSLINYLLSTKPVYRAEAALALASVQDSTAALQLGSTLLEDVYLPARINAAFALGQTGSNAAVNALIPALTDSSSEVVNEVLQALGKCITARDKLLLTEFQPQDTLQEQGVAWGFYYAGLRGLADSSMIKRAEKFLQSASIQTRLGAAHFFNRAGVSSIPLQGLIEAAVQDSNPYVRMASTSALRKSTSNDHLNTLKKILISEVDYRVRVSAARVVTTKANILHDELVLLALADTNVHVSVAAAEGVRNDFTKKSELLSVARNTKHIRVRSLLFKILLNDHPELEKEIKTEFEQSNNPYTKSFLIQALSSQMSAHLFLAKEMVESTVPVIKTSAALALVSLNKNKNFSTELRPVFADAYRKALLSGDVGVISIIAPTLTDTTLGYKTAYSDFSFLYETRKKLSLPKDYEALQPLNEAIAYFERKEKPQPPENEFNHPINWKLVNQISKNQQVEITTTQGVIVLQLLVEEAPGSVANFIELMDQKYFDGRFVHRVVPNFVIQAGCYRGDGFGSEAYSIRSEFSRSRYTEGSVGMASAGKDTEGTQWFITHSPTPHLNGKYTIFARIVSGMEVVHKIEIGDQILSAHLLDN